MSVEKIKKEYIKVFKKIINERIFNHALIIFGVKLKRLYGKPEDNDIFIDTHNKKGYAEFYDPSIRDGKRKLLIGKYRFKYKIKWWRVKIVYIKIKDV